VRFLIALRRAVPSQVRRVSEYSDRPGEQQHRSMRNRHSWRFRRWVPAPAFPDRRICSGGRGRVSSEGRECSAKGKIFSFRRILGEGDTHVHVEAWWAVANKIPPINIRPEQPLRCFPGCRGSYLGHASV
jgi:hypothetical protein